LARYDHHAAAGIEVRSCGRTQSSSVRDRGVGGCVPNRPYQGRAGVESTARAARFLGEPFTELPGAEHTTGAVRRTRTRQAGLRPRLAHRCQPGAAPCVFV
jgi:hypothetical protein